MHHFRSMLLGVLSLAVGCSGQATPQSSAEDLALNFGTPEELHAEMVALAREGLFHGVVLLAEADDVVFHRAYGVADHASMRPIMPDTRFDIGSLGKLFTSVAVLRLAQEGRLDLDDPLGRHIDHLGADPGGRITIRHLLQHRSGLDDYLGHPDFEAEPARFRSVDDYMRLVGGEELAFDPGDGLRYSNSGFVALGAVIEAVTGEDYHDVVRDQVLRVAGMDATGPGRDDRSATGYTQGPRGRLISTGDRWPPVASPAGGSHSTAGDLHRFVRALMEDQLLEPTYTDTLLRNFEGPGGDPIDRHGSWDIGWSGGAAGLSAALGFDAGRGAVLVVLSNLDPPAALAVAEAITMRLREVPLLPEAGS
jgi:D-alanyl-D-alanine carboxypeptidase